jgi:hypothetical protein
MLITLLALVGLFMKKLFITINALILIIFSGVNLSAEENYCLDKQSWEEWENLIKKYPDDIDIQTLHALRLGLCVKVERGDLSVQQATDIFEKARDNVIEKKKAMQDDKLNL